MESIMQLRIDGGGIVCTIYDETLDLSVLGPLVIQRASHVEPDESGQWWVDLAPVQGPRLGPFPRRSKALAAERGWLELYRPRPFPR
jgi:hypothetical protein